MTRSDASPAWPAQTATGSALTGTADLTPNDWQQAGTALPNLGRAVSDTATRRMLIICHSGDLGGAEYVLLDIARHYGSRCHVLLFADGKLAQRLAADGIGCTVLPAGRRMLAVRREAGLWRASASAASVAWFALRVARIARRYDVLYPTSQKAAVVTMLVATLIRRPVVWHLHDILSAQHFAPLQRWLVTRLANLCARRVIVVSQAARQSFIDCGGDPARAVVVYNGFDSSDAAVTVPPDIARIKQACRQSDGALVGLFGRISRWKGQHVLLHALSKAPGHQALIVGEALFDEGDYLAELRALAAELGVADRVHWLGHRDDVQALMSAVDVVVHTSTSPEPFGRVIVEGMLASRPVIATDHGASRELLGDAPIALVPPGDPDLLAKALRRLLALSPEEQARIGPRNRDRAMSLFSMRTMLEGVEQAVALGVPG